MRASLLLVLAFAGCATDPQADTMPADPGTQTAAHVSWSLTIDGAPASCADVHATAIDVTYDGPDVAQVCTTDDDEPLPVTSCVPRSYSYACGSDGADTMLDAGQGYVVGGELEIGANRFGARANVTAAPDMDVPLVFELASIDVSWELAPDVTYDRLEILYNAWGFEVPFTPTGATRVLVTPGSDTLLVIASDSHTHASRTLADMRLTVPRTGTSLALRPGELDVSPSLPR